MKQKIILITSLLILAFHSISQTTCTSIPPTPTPISNQAICENTIDTINLKIDLRYSQVLPESNFLWFDSTATISGQDSITGYLKRGETIQLTGISKYKYGSHNFYLSQTVNSCQSDKHLVRLLIQPKPQPPLVTPNSSCEGTPFQKMFATGELFSSFFWFSSSDLTYCVSQRSLSFTPDTLLISSSGYTPFWVTQVSQVSCVSNPTKVLYHLITKPIKPKLVNDTLIVCNDSTINTFQITNNSITGSFIWKNNTGTKIADGEVLFTISTPNTTSNTNYFAYQLDSGCYSSPSIATLDRSHCSSTDIIPINLKSLNLLKLFPNPIKSSFKIDTDKEITVIIYSITGLIILETRIKGDESIQTSNIPNGLYVVKIIKGNSESVQKIIIDNNE